MSVKVKICGITDEEMLEVAIEAGADFIGLVLFPPSPRHLEIERAARLAALARGRSAIVALTVDADDALIDAIACHVRPDCMQLHGRETPRRARWIGERTGAAIIKAFRVRAAEDVEAARAYADVMAFPLFDAWVAQEHAGGLPGGSGRTFDWSLLRGRVAPFMLAGGLNPDNVARAIRHTQAPMVDVSSGVESMRGIKDAEKIRAFVKNARDPSGQGQ